MLKVIGQDTAHLHIYAYFICPIFVIRHRLNPPHVGLFMFHMNTAKKNGDLDYWERCRFVCVYNEIQTGSIILLDTTFPNLSCEKVLHPLNVSKEWKHSVQSHSKSYQVFFIIIFPFLVCRAGMALTNTANDFQKDALGQSNVALNTISDGVLNYTSDVLKVSRDILSFLWTRLSNWVHCLIHINNASEVKRNISYIVFALKHSQISQNCS